ncbi:speckle-type POZ protein [Bombus vosnesenskii]|uniref:Probable small nuclear ribonucleoprotein E n=1 Tax=Bombus vosnesenskii TaxID=207650 RepID=A0A6J3KJ27_9HYME|nr:speckle-type POZ protein [Bombus vancouverensis nearcticus]XP_033351914.1 speckle-type POZ protein [Bombus vosnesenskii]
MGTRAVAVGAAPGAAGVSGEAGLAGVPRLLEDLARLSEDKDTADIVFLLGRDETPVYAHRIILQARCKNFTAAKRIGTPGNPTSVRMLHAHPETFRQFIHYIYTGKIMLQDSGIFEMLGLAQELGVEELWRSCEEHVSATLSPGNACALLTAALDAQERVPDHNTKMSYKGPQKVQKVMVQPINLIFRYLQNRSRVQVWLFENINLRIEGHIVGFDEYMNLVLDDAEEYNLKTKARKPLGRIMLKGDNITLIQNTNPGAN